MAEESAFPYLRKYFTGRSRRRVFYSSDTDYKGDDIPDDIGSKVLKELKEKEGKLERHDIWLALEFFAEDYEKSRERAKWCYKKAHNVRISKEEQDECLNEAWRMTVRAEIDLQGIEYLDPQINYYILKNHQPNLESIRNFKRSLYLLTEFPDRYEEFMVLQLKVDFLDIKMKIAAAREDYASAIKMREEIKDLESRFPAVFSVLKQQV